MRPALLLVFAGVLALLSFRAVGLHLADTYLDPIAKIDAQDEAMYASNALYMARHGDWLTPHYQGRLALYKPPLLAWLAGAFARIAGGSAFVLRLPVMLFAALTACLLFAWCGQNAAGLAAVLLLVSSRLWFTVSSLCLTDSLLAAFLAVAAFCLWADPGLESPRARHSFTLATAASILVKSVAGIVPLLVLLAFRALAKPATRTSWRRIGGVVLGTAVVVAPWGLYQLAVHPRWFWNEFVLSEIFTYGVSSPIQTTAENPVFFYLKRLFLLDPVITVLAAAALPGLWRAWRRGENDAAVLLAWIGVVLGVAFFWSYRNATYLVPAIPALALAGSRVLPPKPAVALFALLFVAKAAFPAEPWGLDLRPRLLHPSIALLDEYAALHRNRELILVDPFDGFYSSTLPLPKVRYCFVSPSGLPPQPALDLHYLGIMVSAEEFAQRDRLAPVWHARLREWGMDSTEPIATAIVARSRDEVANLFASHPGTDFLLPDASAPPGFRLHLSPNP
jgi:4-amino-4-deoxy-L-arabinose transferase-like glycosyltransferase